ncbi:MAG: hypothetical protein P8P48_07660 [Saprospiraceae bacterium]|nr:hypothetical protein [Saprospiraceae bacterium]
MRIYNKITRHLVCHELTIDADCSTVWNTIAMPGNLNLCHPFCKENQVYTWGKIGAEDSIEYFNGLMLKRVFTDWREGEGYTLKIGNSYYASAKVVWSLDDVDVDKTALKIQIHLYPDIVLDRVPLLLKRLVMNLIYMPLMKRYVHAVTQGVKFYIETGERVKANQFGYNPLFSKRKDKIEFATRVRVGEFVNKSVG